MLDVFRAVKQDECSPFLNDPDARISSKPDPSSETWYLPKTDDVKNNRPNKASL
jgi:hypothetical protein